MGIEKPDLRNVLHITHPWGGGIPTYIEDLKQASAEVHQVFSMTCWLGMINVKNDIDGQPFERKYYLGEEIKLRDHTNQKYSQLLSQILEELHIDIVHIDSAVGHTFDIFIVPYLRNVPIVCTIHDFFYICPTFHLVDKNGNFCNICSAGEENYKCIKNHEYLYSNFDGDDLLGFRLKFKSLISNVDIFIFPSNSTKEIFTQFYCIEESSCRVIYHGTSLPRTESVLPPRRHRNLRIGIIGSMLKHKGKATVNAVIRSLRNFPIEFYHFGDGDLEGKNLTNLGRYDQGNIQSLLSENQIDVSLLLSSWPETFSYTLTESISANIPPIVSNMGALSERVAIDKIGWIVDYKDVKGIVALIKKLSKDENRIEKVKKRICKVKLKNLSEMIQEYDLLYENLLIARKDKIVEPLNQLGLVQHLNGVEFNFLERFARLQVIKISFIIFRIKSKIISLF